MLREAEQRFATLGLHNITTLYGDGYKGWPEQAPFERMIVTAAAAEVPATLADQLSEEGGMMLVPVGPRGEQEIVRVSRTDQGYKTEKLLPVRFVPMVEGLPRPN